MRALTVGPAFSTSSPTTPLAPASRAAARLARPASTTWRRSVLSARFCCARCACDTDGDTIFIRNTTRTLWNWPFETSCPRGALAPSHRTRERRLLSGRTACYIRLRAYTVLRARTNVVLGQDNC
eukprot:1178097-Prorocentrum_minimum.AAC.1